ncbi:hypothetical protein QW180_08560 [Vibrio sinaloensis]|nr:hypothetical protein [Vibrio sinaloensis]
MSTSQIIVKQPDSASTMDPSMALLSGLGVKPTNEDIQLVQFYITSYDMFNKLNSDLDLVDHYKAEGWSSITRFYEASNKEQVFFDVYKKYVTAKNR